MQIGTTYTPKQTEVIVEILDKSRVLAEFHDIETEYIYWVVLLEMLWFYQIKYRSSKNDNKTN